MQTCILQASTYIFTNIPLSKEVHILRPIIRMQGTKNDIAMGKEADKCENLGHFCHVCIKV